MKAHSAAIISIGEGEGLVPSAGLAVAAVLGLASLDMGRSPVDDGRRHQTLSATDRYETLQSSSGNYKKKSATSDGMAKTEKKLNPISVRLDSDVRAALERAAAEDGRTLTGYINRTLRLHLEAKGALKPVKPTRS